MRPVDQTTFGFPGGNCFSACVASILELPIEDVPYFMGDGTAEGTGGQWWDRFLAWLAPRGYVAVYHPEGSAAPEGLHILSGHSPRRPEDRGAMHAVVARGTEILHDPHPSRAGLLSHDDFIVIEAIP